MTGGDTMTDITIQPFESVLIRTLESKLDRLTTAIGDAIECIDAQDIHGAVEILRAAITQGEREG